MPFLVGGFLQSDQGGGAANFSAVPNGSAANPGLGFVGAPTTGLSLVGADLVFSITGTERMRLAGSLLTLASSGGFAVQTNGNFFFVGTSCGIAHLSTGMALQSDAGTQQLKLSDTGLGFNTTAAIAKPTVTGAKAANAALGSLMTALSNYGLVVDSTTA